MLSRGHSVIRIYPAFFINNYATWSQISYTKLRKIFREGCQRELDLWAIGEEPGDV
jgi:hypothetical protein